MCQTHTYDLSFVASDEQSQAPPEIVFTIEECHLPEVVDRLLKIGDHLSDYINAYLEDDELTFTLPIPDLLGDKYFGYGNCGYWTVENEQVHLRLQMRPYPWTKYCSLTIFLLTKALGFSFENKTRSSQLQDVELVITSKPYHLGGYGHAIGGWISENVLNWLRSYVRNSSQSLGITEYAPMPPEVLQSQQATWLAVSSPEMQSCSDPRDTYGFVHHTGSFSLQCFGYACDLSVYPDSYLEEEHVSAELGCHNLDTAEQQLTLLAGLAKICQLARQSS